jgi:hypothetical protein
MKITITKKEFYNIYRTITLEQEIDIDSKLFAEIESGEHEEWDSIEEWAESQATDNDNMDIVDEDDTYIEQDEMPEYEVDYDQDQVEAA